MVVSDSRASTATPPPTVSSKAAADALVRVFRNTSRAAISVAERITSDPELAEDLVQVALARCWEKRQTWRDPDRLAPLLLTTTRNLAINVVRDDQIHANALQTHIPSRAPDTPAADLQRAELEATVTVLIRGLPPRRRRVFVLRACHGLSVGEVSTRLGIRPQAVANHLAAARKQLKQSLEESGWV